MTFTLKQSLMIPSNTSIYTYTSDSIQKPYQDEQTNARYWSEKQLNQNVIAHETPVVSSGNAHQENDSLLQEEGKDEQIKNEALKKEEDKKTINDLVKKSNRCIISISSLFPWDLFANTIQVEESRVTFIFRQFLSSQSHSVDIRDISNVFIESSWYFATLQVVSRTYIHATLNTMFCI